MYFLGVRLRLIGSHLNMEVQVTNFDFKTGKLNNTDKSYWLGNDGTEFSDPPRLVN